MNMPDPAPTAHNTEPGKAPVRYVLGAAALSLGLIWTLLAEEPWGWLWPETVLISLNERYYDVPERRLESLTEQSPDRLTQAQTEALARLEAAIAEETDALFARVGERVPDFADWYYSMGGMTARGITGAMGLFVDDPTDHVEQALTQRLFPEERWEYELNRLEWAIGRAYSREFDQLEGEWLAWLEQSLSRYRVEAPEPSAQVLAAVNVNERIHRQISQSLDTERAAVQMGASGITGLGATLAVRSLSAASARAIAARAGTRLATRGTAAAASTACAGTGPLAIACGLVVFSSVTLGTEWALLKADESMNRDDLEAALHASLSALQASMQQDLNRQWLSHFQEDADQIQQAVTQSIRPVDRLQGASQ